MEVGQSRLGGRVSMAILRRKSKPETNTSNLKGNTVDRDSDIYYVSKGEDPCGGRLRSKSKKKLGGAGISTEGSRDAKGSASLSGTPQRKKKLRV